MWILVQKVSLIVNQLIVITVLTFVSLFLGIQMRSVWEKIDENGCPKKAFWTFTCGHCGKRFVEESVLMEHLRSHNKELS